jgi:hypothetical protein
MTEVEKLINVTMKRVMKSDPVDATEAITYVLSAIVFANAMTANTSQKIVVDLLRETAHSQLDKLLDITEALASNRGALQ